MISTDEQSDENKTDLFQWGVFAVNFPGEYIREPTLIVTPLLPRPTTSFPNARRQHLKVLPSRTTMNF